MGGHFSFKQTVPSHGGKFSLKQNRQGDYGWTAKT